MWYCLNKRETARQTPPEGYGRKNTMEASKVYYTDFRCPVGTSLLEKLRRVCIAAGIKDIDMDGRFVAIKMHFGELGNLAFLRPNYAKVVADLCKEQGGMPFLTDCNTLYPGSRKNALEHLSCAQLNGFWPMTTGCQVIIGDGLRGTDEVEVPVPNGEYCKTARSAAHHGCGRVHQPDPLQRPRVHRLRRCAQEYRHGLRLSRGQDGAARCR